MNDPMKLYTIGHSTHPITEFIGMLADALTVRGIEVVHIMGEGKDYSHKLTPFAEVNGLDITYPPDPTLQVD